MRPEEIFSRDREVLGGELVFAGTRVPVRNLVEHLAAGDSLDDFVEGFPGVSREQAASFLMWALDAARRKDAREEGAVSRSGSDAVVEAAAKRRVPGSFGGRLVMREDFDDPLPDGAFEDWFRGGQGEHG